MTHYGIDRLNQEFHQFLQFYFTAMEQFKYNLEVPMPGLQANDLTKQHTLPQTYLPQNDPAAPYQKMSNQNQADTRQ